MVCFCSKLKHPLVDTPTHSRSLPVAVNYDFHPCSNERLSCLCLPSLISGVISILILLVQSEGERLTSQFVIKLPLEMVKAGTECVSKNAPSNFNVKIFDQLCLCSN